MYRLYMAIAEDVWILPAGNLTDSALLKRVPGIRFWGEWILSFPASNLKCKPKQQQMAVFLSPCWWHHEAPHLSKTTQKAPSKLFLGQRSIFKPPNQLWMERRNQLLHSQKQRHPRISTIRSWSKKSIFEAMSFRRVFQQFASLDLRFWWFVGSLGFVWVSHLVRKWSIPSVKRTHFFSSFRVDVVLAMWISIVSNDFSNPAFPGTAEQALTTNSHQPPQTNHRWIQKKQQHEEALDATMLTVSFKFSAHWWKIYKAVPS